jgi:hypothetical protein
MYEKTDLLADWLTENAPYPFCQPKPSWTLLFRILLELVLRFLTIRREKSFWRDRNNALRFLVEKIMWTKTRAGLSHVFNTQDICVAFAFHLAPLQGASLRGAGSQG